MFRTPPKIIILRVLGKQQLSHHGSGSISGGVKNCYVLFSLVPRPSFFQPLLMDGLVSDLT